MSLCLRNLNQKNVKPSCTSLEKKGEKYLTLLFFPEEEKDKFTPLLAKFENYCIPKKNVTMERHKFNT